MNRIKLFLYFSWMAWASLINPQMARNMIDCAFEGAEARHRARVKAHYEKLFRNTKAT
jgi:hypothetical protein